MNEEQSDELIRLIRDIRNIFRLESENFIILKLKKENEELKTRNSMLMRSIVKMKKGEKK